MNTEAYGDALDGALKEIARLHEANQELLEALLICESCRPLGYETMTTALENKVRSAIAKAGGSNAT